jgi:hypothetical protein
MEIDDAIQAVVSILKGDPIPDRAEPVPDVEVAGRLNPRKDPVHRGKVAHSYHHSQDEFFLGLTAFGLACIR